MNQNKKRVTITISPQIWHDTKVCASLKEQSASQVINNALHDYLQNQHFDHNSLINCD